MTVTIPSTDVANAALQAQINQLTTLIAANPLSAGALTNLQVSLQTQLVQNLIANAAGTQSGNGGTGAMASHLSPATILSTCTVNT